MNLEKTVLQLSDIERKTLTAITLQKKAFKDIAQESGVHVDSVRRALQWLSQKGLVELLEQKTTVFQANEAGELAERKMLNILSAGKKTIDEMKKELGEKELSFCLGKLKKLNLISIEEGAISLTSVGEEFLSDELPEEKLVEKIVEKGTSSLEGHEQELLKELVKRGIVEQKEIAQVSAGLTPEGEKAKQMLGAVLERHFNILDPVPEIFAGKKQPYQKFLETIKRKLSEMGFEEMPERLITQEFYNFDVLFQPQNHPARTWTDTYRLKKPMQGKLPDKKKVNAVKAAHENGGKTLSRGWGYAWSEEIASRLMPNAHGTSADARKMIAGVTPPAKFFVVNRCFRPDVLDATHLLEFNQLDGFIVGEGLNFPKLLGILKDFAQEIAGATDVKFIPDYYPFTEPSCELAAKHPEVGWIEIGGAGIFRPEITENLGIKGPVLAWGLGVDRLAMIKLKINDIRQIFSDDLKWLRNKSLKDL
ncbi:MAG: phenylalanine--tRNA ligase subunit alpha [archaeon]|nr:phenylalanine--tRNA ligase subunit alpha [archaeon]